MDIFQELGALAFGSRLKRLSDRFMSEVASIYAAQEIPFEPRWLPLFSLLARRGDMAIGEAATVLGVSHVAVSQIVQEMSSAGVVHTKKDSQDKRRVVLSLSSKGYELHTQLGMLWEDIRRSVEDVIQSTGVDLLAALARVEKTLDADSLVARTQRRIREREEAVEIVGYRPEFREAFCDLNALWIQQYFRLEPEDQKIFRDPEGCILDGGGSILFALRGGFPVGTVALVRHTGARMELCKMAVHPQSQGLRIGKRLMQAALDQARAAGARKVFLETNDRLAPAVNLYRSFGFKPIALPKDAKYDRVNLVMEVDLDAEESRSGGLTQSRSLLN